MTQPPESAANRLPCGSYPAMPTAFHDDGSIDWEGVDRLTEFCIESGAAGIFACGLSAEILHMDRDEVLQVASRIIERAAGRLPIIMSAISSESPEAQAELVRRMHDAGSDAVAIAVCQLATPEEDEDTWIQRAESLLELIPADVRLAMYECPLPYQRLLSDQALGWAAASGRFCFLKDTCCCIDTIRRRLEIIRDSPLQMFNANTATLLSSLQAGADGFCGIGANFMPELYTWLCSRFATEPETAARLQQFMDTTFDITEDSTYPASAKDYLQKRGLAIGAYSRKVPDGPTAEGCALLAEMRQSEQKWLDALSLPTG